MVSLERFATAVLAIILVSLVGPWAPAVTASDLPLLGNDDDAGSGTDAGDERADALPVSAGLIHGNLTREIDESDYFRWTVPASSNIEITMQGEGARFSAFDTVDTHAIHGCWTHCKGYTNDVVTIFVRAWYTGVLAESRVEATYTIHLQSWPMAQNDAGAAMDAPIEWGRGLPVGAGQVYGNLTTHDFGDGYVFELSEATHVTLRFEPLVTGSDASAGMVDLPDFSHFVNDDGSGTLEATGWYEAGLIAILVKFDGYLAWQEEDRPDLPYRLTIELVDDLPPPPADLSDLAVVRFEERRDDQALPTGHRFTQQDEHDVELEIVNEGAAAARPFTVLIRMIKPDGSWTNVLDVRVDALEPGERQTFTTTWGDEMMLGNRTLQARLDFWNQVQESDETNNDPVLDTWARLANSPVHR